jgi:hypothetical protein
MRKSDEAPRTGDGVNRMSTFQPKNPDYRAIATATFEHDGPTP